ncbi:hypothetical protein N431DRAFT_466233 [Stipitochalara longipes BDJ]|nr:hypothetical protein N431DRAFT_466233 [Stipitochalara longipes BDJ]
MAIIQDKKISKPMSWYFKTDNPAGPSMVCIYVGPERTLWVLPEKILCDRLDFFQSAFQGRFRESNDKVLELPEDDPIAFEVILDYILEETLEVNAIKNLTDPKAIHMAWFRAWILADKIGCSEVLLLIGDEYRFYLCMLPFEKRIIPPDAVKFLYENTSTSCQMRTNITNAAVEAYKLSLCLCEPFIDRWLKSAASYPKYLSDIMIQFKMDFRGLEGSEITCLCKE